MPISKSLSMRFSSHPPAFFLTAPVSGALSDLEPVKIHGEWSYLSVPRTPQVRQSGGFLEKPTPEEPNYKLISLPPKTFIRMGVSNKVVKDPQPLTLVDPCF